MGLSINSFFADVRRGDLGAVKRALGSQPGALHARAGADQRTALHVAADVGNHLVLRTLLAQGADCAAADAAGEVPLMLAARQGHLAVVRELLADAGRRGCLRAMNRDGATPLHAAAAAGQAAVAQLLLDLGARPDARDRLGRTPADVVPPEAAATARVLAHGRTPAGAPRSPGPARSTRPTPCASPCKSPLASPGPQRAAVQAGIGPGAAPMYSAAAPAGPAAGPTAAAGPRAMRGSSAQASHAASSAASPSRSAAGAAAAPQEVAAAPAAGATLPIQAADGAAPLHSDSHMGSTKAQAPEVEAPDGAQPAAAPAAGAEAGGTLRRSLIGLTGPLHTHQQTRADDEQAKWHKVNCTVQGLLKLLEEQEARIDELEAANAAASARLADQHTSLVAGQQQQQAQATALSDSVRALLAQGEALMRFNARRRGSAADAEGDEARGQEGDDPLPLDPAVEEFMEATSGCLQLHEKRLDDLQAAVPMMRAAAKERAQVAELQRQVSSLETMLAVLTGGRPGTAGAAAPPPPTRPTPAMSCGPLSALPAMQQQVAALSAEFDRMRAAVAGEVARVRADTEADRADRADARERAAAAAEAAAVREAALRAEVAERDARLEEIRAAALSEAAAREELLALERALEARLEALAVAQEETARQLQGVQSAVNELQAQAQAVAAEAGAHAAAKTSSAAARAAATPAKASARAAALSNRLAQALELALSASAVAESPEPRADPVAAAGDAGAQRMTGDNAMLAAPSFGAAGGMAPHAAATGVPEGDEAQQSPMAGAGAPNPFCAGAEATENPFLAGSDAGDAPDAPANSAWHACNVAAAGAPAGGAAARSSGRQQAVSEAGGGAGDDAAARDSGMHELAPAASKAGGSPIKGARGKGKGRDQAARGATASGHRGDKLAEAEAPQPRCVACPIM